MLPPSDASPGDQGEGGEGPAHEDYREAQDEEQPTDECRGLILALALWMEEDTGC